MLIYKLGTIDYTNKTNKIKKKKYLFSNHNLIIIIV